MRILVTGASGFIGRHVARALLSGGHDVTATGRSASALESLGSSGARIVSTDLAADPLDDLTRGQDAVVNCAALASPWGRRELFVRNNVETAERLMIAAGAAGVKRLVHLSSPSIYASRYDQLGVSEAFTPPRHWASPYGETKWLSEQIVLDARFAALEPVVLRPRAVFGTGDRTILPRILNVARKGIFPLVNGGRAMIDVTYVANVVRAVELALTTPAQNTRRAYNITNGEPMPVRELLGRLFAILGLRVKLIPLNESVVYGLATLSEAIARLSPRGSEPRLTRYGISLLAHSLTLDITAARERLGYSPYVSLQEGFEHSAALWRQNAPA
jgi:nucleoside-diphosphate-sugar epimerase